MEVILLENVGNLGALGDKVDVKPGYGRNFLIPQGKAVPATEENVAKFETRRAELEAAAAAAIEAAQKRAEAISALARVEIAATAGEEGKLFGSVGPIDIVEAFSRVGVETARSEIRMPEGPIHEVGEFVIGVHLHPEINVEVTVRVVAEE